MIFNEEIMLAICKKYGIETIENNPNENFEEDFSAKEIFNISSETQSGETEKTTPTFLTLMFSTEYEDTIYFKDQASQNNCITVKVNEYSDKNNTLSEISAENPTYYAA